MTRLFLIFCLFLTSATAWAQAPDTQDTGTDRSTLAPLDAALHQGDVLTMEGDYYRAITAYKSFLILAPSDDIRRGDVELRIAWIYYVARKPAAAVDVLRPLVLRLGDSPESRWARLRLGQVLMESPASAAGRNNLERLAADCEALQAPECKDISTAVRLSLASFYADSFRFEAAASQLALVPKESHVSRAAYRVSDYLRTLNIPTKNPALAGVLSVIPGLGHVYIEDYSVAALALIWNGLFIFATVDAVVDQQWGQAALLGTLELIWYSGTIFGAVAGAHRFNRDAERIVREGLTRDIESMDDDSPWSTGLSDYPNFRLKLKW